MANKEGRGIKIGIIFAIPFMGVVLYMAIAVGFNLLFMYNLIPTDYMGLVSKILMFVIALIVCSAVKGRIKTEGFINCILAGFIFCVMMLCASIACSGGKINAAGAIICVMISVIGCFGIFIKNHKYSKMHKKRRKRK